MRLTNARRSIHDAFAIHLGGPADGAGGGAPFNSNRWLGNAGLAGQIIKAVLNQPSHLRGTAIFLNAPENTVTLNDMIAMKSALWTKFIKKGEVSPADQGVLIAYIDRILMGYRARVWNHESQLHTAGKMFSAYSDERAQRLTELANRMLDILHAFDSSSLAPVWTAIDDEREAEAKVANA